MTPELPVSLDELASLPKPEPRVTFDAKEGMIWIRASYPYPIETSRIVSVRDLLAWVRHLSRKTWADRLLIGEFIAVVAEARKFDLRIKK